MFESRAYRYATFLLLGGLITIYMYWIFQASAGLLPVWSDEFCYYVNARSFTENTTLRAAFTYTGKGSLLFQSDAHGFAYPLMHGTIGKIIGFHPLNIPFTNISFIILSLLIISCQKHLLVSQKTTIAVMLMAYILAPLYAFTYMQEVLHFFFAVCCTLLLCEIYETESKRLVFLYLLLLVVAAFFRPLWLFWSIGLLPLSKDKKQFFKFSLIVIFYSALSFVFAKLLYEDLPSYFSIVTKLIVQGRMPEAAQSLYAHVILNIESYFTGELSKPYPYYLTKLVIFSSVVAMAGLYRVRKEKIYFAAALVGAVNFGLLLTTYDAWDWREIRTMSPLFFMFTIIIVSKKEVFLTLACLVFVITSFPSVHNLASKNIMEHKMQAMAYKYKAPLEMPPKQMATLLDTKLHPLILLGYLPDDYTLDLLLLPLSTPTGKTVRYAINYYGENLGQQAYDYVIYRSNITPDGSVLRPVLKMSYFNLYQSKGTDGQ